MVVFQGRGRELSIERLREIAGPAETFAVFRTALPVFNPGNTAPELRSALSQTHLLLEQARQENYRLSRTLAQTETSPMIATTSAGQVSIEPEPDGSYLVPADDGSANYTAIRRSVR